MGVLRHVVFPALRLVVWTVIALALCVLAFGRGGGTEEVSGPLSPGMDLEASVVEIGTGDVSSTVEVTGTVAADPATTVRATANGTVSRVHAAVGDVVAADTPLFDIRVPLPPREGSTVTAPDGTVTSSPPQERFRIVTVEAGAPGTLASLTVLADQEVGVGTDVATVSPGTLSVSAPLTQSQQFRLLAPPASASAQAPGGPAPFECIELRTGAAESGSGQPQQPDPWTGEMPEASTANVTCKVPGGTTVFAGMSVNLTIDLGTAEGVVVVPVTAVLGTVGEGRVWVHTDGGEPEERPVTLGLSDGEQVQVTEGLAAGEQVLQFAPVGSDDPVGPDGMPADEGFVG